MVFMLFCIHTLNMYTKGKQPYVKRQTGNRPFFIVTPSFAIDGIRFKRVVHDWCKNLAYLSCILFAYQFLTMPLPHAAFHIGYYYSEVLIVNWHTHQRR